MPNVLAAEEVAALRELRAQGASIGEIARATRHSKSTVHRHVAGQGGRARQRSVGPTTRGDLTARVERLEDVLLQLLALLSARCGFCSEGSLGLVIRCSGCRKELLLRWKDEAEKAVLEGKVVVVWPEAARVT